MTDQERLQMHWPKGWAEMNLPGSQRLKRHSLYFNRAYTAVAQCSPSCALIQTAIPARVRALRYEARTCNCLAA
jgi:hypothetical protein